jgi:hypothetical protein
VLWFSLSLVALISAGATAYCRMFSRFSFWDDDGYVLISIRSLLQGSRIYDDISTLYGPFYFLVHWIVYAASGHPVTHDAERFLGIAWWLISACLWTRVAYVLTRSHFWALFVFFLTVKLLDFFPLSVGHPEEICMVLLSTVAALSCSLGPKHTAAKIAAIAVAVAALALTKVNTGAYVALAVTLALLQATVPARLQRFARYSAAAAAIALPAVLMAPLFDFAWARIYCFVAAATIGAVILVGSRTTVKPFVTARIGWIAALSFLACILIVCLPFLLQGTSLATLFYPTGIRNKNWMRSWYIPAPADSTALLVACVSLAILALVQWRGYVDKRGARGSRPIGSLLTILKGAVGLCLLGPLLLDPDNTLNPLFTCCAPFVWLLMVDPIDGENEEIKFGHLTLCLITALVYLYPFPVAGTQASSATVPVAVVAVLLLRDSLIGVLRRLPAAVLPARAMGIILVVALFAREFHNAHLVYESGVSLGMPGAERIRVAPQTAGLYQWMKRNLDSCPAIYSVPGLFSLYFWTGKEPPTSIAMSNAIGMLSESDQQTVVSDLSRHPGLCIVYSPTLIEFWRRGQDLSRSPIVRYVKSEFTPAAGKDGYFILKKK